MGNVRIQQFIDRNLSLCIGKNNFFVSNGHGKGIFRAADQLRLPGTLRSLRRFHLCNGFLSGEIENMNLLPLRNHRGIPRLAFRSKAPRVNRLGELPLPDTPVGTAIQSGSSILRIQMSKVGKGGFFPFFLRRQRLEPFLRLLLEDFHGVLLRLSIPVQQNMAEVYIIFV